MKEYRYYGPPGVGKTTKLVELASKAIAKYGSDQVSICSLTNSAISEIFSRDVPVDLENTTTLHARCKRSLQAPPPAESYMKEFARDYPGFASPECIRSLEKRYDIEDAVITSGMTLYDRCQVYRQQKIPLQEWISDAQKWYGAWSEWCLNRGVMDYTSWLEDALASGSLPDQQVVIVDEAQDHTPLQLDVLRSWRTRTLILIGDDDQSLYEWAGVIPEEFFSESIPFESEHVLSQSFRIPRKVHHLANQIISRIAKRKAKIFKPRDFEGTVSQSKYTLIDTRESLIQGLGDDRSHMILTSCAYMLDDLLKSLKVAGIQFYNPYRRSNPKWNPMMTEAAIAARSYLRDPWTGHAVKMWSNVISDGAFRDKVSLIKLCESHLNDDISECVATYLNDSASNLLSRKPEALLQWKRPSVVGAWDYYIKVFKMGVEINPKIIVGTIHSVKGGEADAVHIFPDLSDAGYETLRLFPDRIHRLFYVAVTRAKESVILHDGSSHRDYPISQILRGGLI